MDSVSFPTNPTAPPKIAIGFDSEWADGRHAETTLPDKTNRLLAYSFAVLNRSTKRMSRLVVPLGGPTHQHRMLLVTLLRAALSKALAEGVIDTIPDRLDLIGHFTRADISNFRDAKRLKREVDAVRKTYVTRIKPIVRDLGTHRNPHPVSIALSDSMLLAPAGSSLKKLGDELGLPKLELPEGAIERMDLYMKSDPVGFDAYAIRDAEIAVLWADRVWTQLANELGVTRRVSTLGSAGVQRITSTFKALGIDRDRYFGREKDAQGVPQPMGCLASVWGFAANCFHGGRNEAFWTGFSPPGVPLFDADLTGAYTSAMALLAVPNWNSTRAETDLDRLAVIDTALTLAHVRFRFPDGTRFPSLPVRAGSRGLIYPLTGQTWCTGPELVSARNQDAELVVMEGYRTEWTDDAVHPLGDFARSIADLRKRAEASGNTILDKIAKEVGNSVYGKVAQSVRSYRTLLDEGLRGQRGKSCFNSRKGCYETLPGSTITNPMIASWITGFVRAVLSEALARLPADAAVASATTDGLLSSVAATQIDVTGPLAQAFRKARLRLTDGRDGACWEEKHRANRVLVTKTRGVYTADPTEGNDRIIIARAGGKLEHRCPNVLDECAQWIELHRTRTYDSKLTRRSLIPLGEQWLEDADMVPIEREVRVNMDADLKRALVDPHDAEGVLCAGSRPHESVEAFNTARDALENWKRSSRRVLKTAGDYADLQTWTVERPGQRAAGANAGSNRPALVNLYLKAAAHGDLGLGGQRYADIAAFVSLCGWPVTTMALKNTRRRGTYRLGETLRLTEVEERFAAQVYSAHPACELHLFAAEGSPARAVLERLRDAGVSRCHDAIAPIAQATPLYVSDSLTGAKPLKLKGGAACARRPVSARSACFNKRYDIAVVRVLRSGSRNPTEQARAWEQILTRLRC